MGCFSWTFADKNNEKRLKMGHKGYILTPDNQFIKTPDGGYEGYGKFFDSNKGVMVDVYDLVVDWNRPHLTEIVNNPLKKKEFNDLYKMLASFAVVGDLFAEEFVRNEVKAERVPNYLLNDWKRCLGIEIACYDEDNQRLPFPIKIVSNKNCGNYKSLPASLT